MLPTKGKVASTLAKSWDMVLAGSSMMTFQDTKELVKQVKVQPPATWAGAMVYLKHWLVLCHVLLGAADWHITTSTIEWLMEECHTQWAQLEHAAMVDPTLATAMLYWVQLKFNASFHNVELTQ